MKSTVKLLVSVLAIGLMTSLPALRAQDNPPPAGGQRQGGGQRGGGRGQMTPAQQIERLETAVGKLTDDQKTKITAIYEKAQKDMQALRDAGGDPQANRPKMQEIQQNSRKDVRALLTPEQQTKFDAMPAPGRGGQGGGQRRGGGGGGGN